MQHNAWGFDNFLDTWSVIICYGLWWLQLHFHNHVITDAPDDVTVNNDNDSDDNNNVNDNDSYDVNVKDNDDIDNCAYYDNDGCNCDDMRQIMFNSFYTYKWRPHLTLDVLVSALSDH